jgi:beta-glucosidase
MGPTQASVSPGAATPRFPAAFVWGAATSAYQVEGAVSEDGRGESIWDRFVSVPGNVAAGHTGNVACDAYHRYREDIQLMRELGLTGYRFSISWPRIFPDGTGPTNGAGLDFYDRFVEELLANGIEPFPTLYHWDLPQALEDAGGWPERSTVDAYAEFVGTVVRRLGDRVDQWITVCEPWVISRLGYLTGEHAPGRRDGAAALAAAHHVLLAHGRGVEALRAVAPRSRVGITIDVVHFEPATPAPADRAAARTADALRNRSIVDPVLCGRYPEELLDRWPSHASCVRDGDLRSIAVPLDFLGINYYTRNVVRAGPAGGLPLDVRVEGAETTGMGWEVYPDGLYEELRRLREDYEAPPLYVTENGAAFPDRREQGRVDDPDRTVYLARHLDAVARALADGVDVRGYFLWSLLDNFEWAYGCTQRFGIVYVDFESLERIPKASFHWYRDLIASEGAGRTRPVAPNRLAAAG